MTGCVGRLLPARGQKFALELKQARFDRARTTKSPQEACQSMSELELDYGSRINSADEVALKRSVGPNVFEILTRTRSPPALIRTMSRKVWFSNCRGVSARPAGAVAHVPIHRWPLERCTVSE